MEDNSKNLPPEPRDDDPEKFTDEVTANKIDRHLHDINDTISEQDIKNIVTDISSPEIPGEDDKNIEEEPLADKKKKISRTDTNDDMPTSWNILE